MDAQGNRQDPERHLYLGETISKTTASTTNSYYFRSRVHVGDDEIVIDLSDLDKQARGPINATYVATSAASCTAILQSICARDVPLNAGTFRPIRVIAPPGTLVNPIFPAPSVAGNTEGQPRIIACVLGAMAKAMPGKIGANEGGTACSLLMGGTHPETGEYWTHYQLEGCGWGGRAKQGRQQLAMAVPTPAQSGRRHRGVPSRFPLRVIEYSLRPDLGGAGMFRGGLGVRRVFEVTAPSVTLSALLDRVKHGSWGLFGGEAGSPAGVFVRHQGEERRSAPSWKPTGRSSPTKFINIELKTRRPVAAAFAGRRRLRRRRNSAATAPCRTISAIVSLRRRVWRRMGGHQSFAPMRWSPFG